MNLAVEAVSFLILLHDPAGGMIYLAPDQITSLHSRRPSGQPHYTETVHCLVGLTDGKAIAVVEDCEFIRRRMEELK